MMPYVTVVAFIGLLWFIIYMILFTVQSIRENQRKKRRLRRSIDRIARAQF